MILLNLSDSIDGEDSANTQVKEELNNNSNNSSEYGFERGRLDSGVGGLELDRGRLGRRPSGSTIADSGRRGIATGDSFHDSRNANGLFHNENRTDSGCPVRVASDDEDRFRDPFPISNSGKAVFMFKSRT